MSFFDLAYEGTPPWDIGRPQPAIVALDDGGEVVGDALDVGCGTGENALFLAERGHRVLGIDTAERAVERARTKALERGLDARFEMHDALECDRLGRRFDTAIDVGMFHTLSDEERPRYERALHGALRPGGRAFVLCWSERNAWGRGPRRVTQMELLGTFERVWDVAIAESRLASALEDEGVHAWLARLRVR